MVLDQDAGLSGFAEAMSDPLSMAVTERDRNTLGMVKTALANQSVALAFQPVVQAKHRDRPAFYEALIRIMDPAGRVIPARDFMGAIETHETGRLVDCLSIEFGLRALRENPELRLSVNMSARSIGYARWNAALHAGLQADPTVAERLILEITESSAMVMPDIVVAFMSNLQDQGISFALDDFGAGYTAFRYLRDFYFDILKIDGSFISGIAGNPDNQVLVQALMSIGQHFDMVTVAEYVETKEDAAYLEAIGVDCLQGYYFGAPRLKPEWSSFARERIAI